MEIARVIILSLTAGFGWVIIAYEGYAYPRGWPVGAWLVGPFSWLQGLAYVALVGAIVASVFAGAWWHAIVVVIAANICVRLLYPIAGPRAQVVALLGVLVGISLSAAMLWL